MKTQIESLLAWALVRLQIAAANLDPEVIQWPGGSVIALLLWLYVAARPLCLNARGSKGPRSALSVQTDRSCESAWPPSRERPHRHL
jgi:hypothetical protein